LKAPRVDATESARRTRKQDFELNADPAFGEMERNGELRLLRYSAGDDK
jgi:hypothetical protein